MIEIKKDTTEIEIEALKEKLVSQKQKIEEYEKLAQEIMKLDGQTFDPNKTSVQNLLDAVHRLIIRHINDSAYAPINYIRPQYYDVLYRYKLGLIDEEYKFNRW